MNFAEIASKNGSLSMEGEANHALAVITYLMVNDLVCEIYFGEKALEVFEQIKHPNTKKVQKWLAEWGRQLQHKKDRSGT
jgi:hypothetical protein